MALAWVIREDEEQTKKNKKKKTKTKKEEIRKKSVLDYCMEERWNRFSYS